MLHSKKLLLKDKIYSICFLRYARNIVGVLFTDNSYLPLDFFAKNSYYLSVGIQFSIPPVLFSGRQGACYGVKIYFIVMKEEFKVKTKVPGSVAYKVLKLLTRQRNSSQKDCGLWTQSADSGGCKSRQSKQKIRQAVTRVRHGQFNRCLCATKDTAEVSRVSNGKWNPCRRPNEVGTVSSYRKRHCAVSTRVSDTCHVAGMRRIISVVLTFIATQLNMIHFSICSMMIASRWYMTSPA